MADTRVVDYQAHWYPPAYFDSIVGRDGPPTARREEGEDVYLYTDAEGLELRVRPVHHSLELHLADMDAHGIDVAVISPNLVGQVCDRPVDEAVAILDLLNGETGRAQREHPERLVGLAMLPMQDPDAALQVLDQAMTRDGLAGVCMVTNIDRKPIVNDAVMPVYRRIEELDVPIFLHPTHQSVVDPVGYEVPITIGLGWMFESAAAALTLVYCGVLDAFPSLQIVHPHLGGALPALTGRVAHIPAGNEPVRELSWYLRHNFVTDSVQQTRGAAANAIDTYGLDRIVFGTDYPWLSRTESQDMTGEMFTPDQVQQILRNTVPNLRLPHKEATT